MGKGRRFATSTIGGFILGRILVLFPLRLIEDAVMGYLNQQIAKTFNITPLKAEAIADPLYFWILPTLLGMLVIWVCIRLNDRWRGRRQPSEQTPEVSITSHDQSGGITAHTVTTDEASAEGRNGKETDK